MMRIFALLLSTPFLLAREKSILNKADADAELAGLYTVEAIKPILLQMLQKVEVGADTNSNNNNIIIICLNKNNPNNKRFWNGQQQNFSGEKGTSSSSSIEQS